MCHRELRLCYVGFLAAIFNAKIAQQMWLFPRSHNSDWSAALSYFKKNLRDFCSDTFRTRWLSQDKFC